ncbi:hypothetical protein MLD38_001519 [Melastoma candidum]|uniref:Uncharacterized protein n=1 Tax=Melastoma candidum TaxID=119954 RepID=A0ACB9SDJ8_9MYRT|nr:hypothetical protein MLD38_001519 [Melastoma candidum]
MGKVDEEEEGKEGSSGNKPSEFHFDEEDSEARGVLRSRSLDSSSSSSSATASNAGEPLSGNTAVPLDHKVEDVMRIPPVSPLPTGYDPNRIPSSVFAGRLSNPAEWSVASNESLFSIHMGKSSFSRDHTALLLYKSGELTKLDEMFSVPTLLPTVSEESLPRDGVSSSVDANSSMLPPAEDKAENLHKWERLPSKDNSPPLDNGNSSLPGETTNSASLSNRSYGSATTASTGSFAFPRLVGSRNNSVSVEPLEGGKTGLSTELPLEPETTPAQPQKQNHRTPVRAALSNCFSFFTRCSFRCPFLHR